MEFGFQMVQAIGVDVCLGWVIKFYIFVLSIASFFGLRSIEL